MTLQPTILPGLFHWTGINSTLHLSTFKWLTNRNWLSLRSLLTHKAAPIHLPYVQTAKLKQKRGCETLKNESVAESELEASSSNIIIQKTDTTTLTTHLFHTPSLQKACTGKSYRNTPYRPHTQQRVAKEDYLLLSSHLVIFFLTLEWEDSRPLTFSYLS